MLQFPFLPILFPSPGLAALAAYLALVLAIALGVWRSQKSDRWAGAILALLMLTLPACDGTSLGVRALVVIAG